MRIVNRKRFLGTNAYAELREQREREQRENRKQRSVSAVAPSLSIETAAVIRTTGGAFRRRCT
jgi:hypothetical protein